jgi:hypothetical protein
VNGNSPLPITWARIPKIMKLNGDVEPKD